MLRNKVRTVKAEDLWNPLPQQSSWMQAFPPEKKKLLLSCQMSLHCTNMSVSKVQDLEV